MDRNNFVAKLTIGVRIYFVVLIAFIVATVGFGYYTLAIGETIVFTILLLYYLTNKKLKKKQITSYIENLTFHLDNATKDTMIHFPLPITFLDLSGKILWYNKKFGDIAEQSVFDMLITEVVPDIQLLKLLENRENINIDVDFMGRHFQVLGNVADVSDKQTKNFSMVLYWIERTIEKTALKKLDDSMPVSCILMIDNFDDLMNNTPDNACAALIATIEKNISTWVLGIGGVIRKYEKDKFFIMFENANLKNVIEQKFSILDVCREIKEGNKIPVTLSIGIGKGETIQQCDKYARAAIDMALGRGGDQAVIKDSEQFKFFGGHSESFEKSTRVKSRVVAYALRELIKQADAVFISGHMFGDFDSFGASIGVSKIARLLGKDAYIIADDIVGTTAKVLQTFSGNEDYKDTFISVADAVSMYTEDSLLVVVDTHKPSYVQAHKLLELFKTKVLIDHHRRGTEYIEDAALTYHEPFASSTCEMITEILQYITDSIKLTPEEAQAIYAGICLDTKNFSIKTGVRTFEAASFLRRMGVDTIAVKKLFQNDLSTYVKRTGIVGNAEIYKEQIAIATWDENERNPGIIASQAADDLLNISNINASFVLCRSGDTILISGRSLGSYNVQIVLEALGGGGHMTVAGAQLKNVSMHEAVTMLKDAIEKS